MATYSNLGLFDIHMKKTFINNGDHRVLGWRVEVECMFVREEKWSLISPKFKKQLIYTNEGLKYSALLNTTNEFLKNYPKFNE